MAGRVASVGRKGVEQCGVMWLWSEGLCLAFKLVFELVFEFAFVFVFVLGA